MKKILIIRFSSIGDIVLTTPVIRATKQQLGCELHLLTKKQYASILENNPNIDKVHSFEQNVNEVLADLLVEKFDHVVDLQKNLRSLKLKRKLARPSTSFPKLNKEKWLLVNFKINRMPDVHIVDRYFEAVKNLGVHNDDKGLDYFIPGSDKVNPSVLGPQFEMGYIGFVIGSRHATKMVPSAMVARIIDRMKLPVLLLGGPEDRENAAEIIKLTKLGDVVSSCGDYSINQSASLVKQAKLIITNDTGLMHIAAAFRKPIISIWGNTVPAFGMYPYLPEKPATSIIAQVNDLKCRPCSKLGFKSCPKKHFKCMMDQDVEGISEQAVDIFNK